jgi:hypothetical protein
MTQAPKLPTIADIRAANMEAGFHFFDRKTMSAFGDTVRSFAVRSIDGAIYLQRIRAMRDRGGRDMGGVGKLYLVNMETGAINSAPRGESV